MKRKNVWKSLSLVIIDLFSLTLSYLLVENMVLVIFSAISVAFLSGSFAIDSSHMDDTNQVGQGSVVQATTHT